MRDLSGRLLYVGVTNGGLRRFMEHAKDKTWWREVAQIDVEHVHCSRRVIEDIEREAIRTERPLYNVAHNVVRVELPPPVANDHVARVLAAATREHHCDPDGSCPMRRDVAERLKLAYINTIRPSRLWIQSKLRASQWRATAPSDQRRISHSVQGALQIAVLLMIARDRDQHCDPDGGNEVSDSFLQFIMQGGWGAPADAFHEVSAGDCVSILHQYFIDQGAIRALGIDGRELCAISAGVEASAVV